MARKNKSSYIMRILVIIGILVVANIISEQLFFRLDFTADKIYTLSKATKNILHELDEPVTVIAYFTEDIPPQLLKARKDFKDMLTEYGNASRGNVVYEFIDPNKSPENEQRALQEGIMPSIMNVRERDQMIQKKVFLGAALKQGDHEEIIPIIQPGSAMEYELSSAIKKLSVKDKQTIGLLQGHGEPSRRALQQVMESLGVLYNVEEVNLNDTSVNLSKYPTLMIVGPTDTIPLSHFTKLDNYLAGGGNLFIAYNRVKFDFSNVKGSSLYTGMEDWLANKGLMVNNNFLVDASCGTVGVQQQSGVMSFTTNISFPYLPVINDFADHPATKGLEQVMLPFASTLTFTGDTSIQYLPLAFSSQKSNTLSPPIYADVNKRWTDADFPLSHLTVAALATGKFSGNAVSKIFLIGDADFPVNGEGPRPQQLKDDNVNFMVNPVDWLTDRSGLIELRTKAITSRPLDQLEDSRKNFLKWLNFLLPIALVILYGIFRNQRSRRLRSKREEEGYV